MKYSYLQQRLKPYQAAGLVRVKLNSCQTVLAAEYQRCLNLGLSQTDLDCLIATTNGNNLALVLPTELYSHPQKFNLQLIKVKAYSLGQVNNLLELKQAFPIFKDQQYDFRTKSSWAKCVYFIDNLTKDSQEFTKFKQDITNFIQAISTEIYHQLTGETAKEEAFEDLSNYISWWKGAQWEYTLASEPTTLDLLKRAWLEQYLAQHNLDYLLKYSPID